MILIVGAVVLLAQSLTPEAISHAQAGADAERQGKLDVAVSEFRKVTELEPQMASGYANLGSAYFRKGDYEAAIPALQKALEINPELPSTHQILGVALLLQGNAAAALPHLEKAPLPELLGLAYLQTGNLGSAIGALQTALGRQPNDPDILYYFGEATALAARQAFAKLGSRAGGQESTADLAAGTIPDLAPVQAKLAKTPNDPELLAAFVKDAAIASRIAFDQILKNHPASARAHQVAAERYIQQGASQAAEREYAAALRINPYTAGVHLAYANLLAADGSFGQALIEYREETRIRPASADAHFYLGEALLQQDNPKEALAELKRANQLGPGTPAILLALGQAALKQRDNDLAKTALTELIGKDNTSDLAAQAHAALAILYRQAGQTGDADRETAEYEKLKQQEAAEKK